MFFDIHAQILHYVIHSTKILHYRTCPSFNFSVLFKNSMYVFQCEYHALVSLFLQTETLRSTKLILNFDQYFYIDATNMLLLCQGLFQEFIACNNHTQSHAHFQNIFKFCTFLPKFSNILPFFCSLYAFFCTHVFTFQNRPCMHVDRLQFKNLVFDTPINQ